MLYDSTEGVAEEQLYELIERDDGWLDISAGSDFYTGPFGRSREERDVLREIRGRVLDIGCGAGRVALALQERGHDVLGIDISPLAIKTARLRGLRRGRVMSITQIDRHLGSFDSIVMLGNNFGLMANPRRARWLLRRFKSITPADGRIVAQSLDVYATEEPGHLRYQRRNRRLGRMSGQIRIRVRYRDLATPYFDYLFVSRPEMEQILEGTGWQVTRTLDTGHATYVAVIEKTPAAGQNA
jgi:SAM-dependent methyltransferase